jgi:ribonuclease D
MIAYAADDVRYLIPLYHLLRVRLEQKKRLDWVLEECDDLSRVRSGPDMDQPLFLRIKGAGRLEPQSLAVLEALLAFRLQIARQKDRPPFKIIGNDPLLDIARAKPENLAALETTRILSDRQRHMYGKQIMAAVQRALSIPADDLPRYPRKPHTVGNGMVLKKFDRLKHWRAKKAEHLGMDPGVLIPNAALKVAAENHQAGTPDAPPGLKNWQKTAFGAEIVAALDSMDKKDDGKKNPV